MRSRYFIPPCAYPQALGRPLGLPRHIASTSKQAGNGDIFIYVLPVEAGAAKLDAFALAAVARSIMARRASPLFVRHRPSLRTGHGNFVVSLP
jgi:hypothetical protein